MLRRISLYWSYIFFRIVQSISFSFFCTFIHVGKQIGSFLSSGKKWGVKDNMLTSILRWLHRCSTCRDKDYNTALIWVIFQEGQILFNMVKSITICLLKQRDNGSGIGMGQRDQISSHLNYIKKAGVASLEIENCAISWWFCHLMPWDLL